MELSSIEQLMLFMMIFGLMMAVGCSVSKAELNELKEQKKEFGLALFLQYLAMPLWALLLTYVFELSSGQAFTLLLIAVCPGGTTSNMFTYFSKGNVSLSVTLTSLTSLFSFVMTPLLLGLYGRSMSLDIPFLNIIATVGLALVPVALGFVIKMNSLSLAVKVKKVGTIMGHIGIGTMIVIWLPKILKIVQTEDFNAFMAIGLLSFLGMTFALAVGLLLGLRGVEARTLAFETGIQNAPLAFVIVQLNYPAEEALELGWIPLVYGALSVGNAIVFTVANRVYLSHSS